jgi:hypothetical protein
MSTVKTIEEITAQMAVIRAAIENDGFIPTPDGKNLSEHLYYLRLGVLDGLSMALNGDEEYENIPDVS